MFRPRAVVLGMMLLAGTVACARAQDPMAAVARAVERARVRLAADVPGWTREHGCASCHHQGDGLRALLIERRSRGGVEKGDELERAARTLLSDPSRWDPRNDAPEAQDPLLVRLQFGATLVVWREGLAAGERGAADAALGPVAARLLEYQRQDGSWRLEGPDGPGGPTAWGPGLATAAAGRVLATRLEAVGAMGEEERKRLGEAVARSRRWFVERAARSTPDAAAVVFGLSTGEGRDRPEVAARRSEAVARLLETQSEGGGWGPYPRNPTEAFDTAVAVVALAERSLTVEPERRRAAIERGVKFLIETQEADGGWAATTRPTGGISEAQRTSTTAWCLTALVAGEDME